MTLRPGVFWVFAGSALLSLSIAPAQPPLAVLIRRWFPTAITRASNLYGNGLLMGNVLGASLSPYISRAIGWRAMFIVWAAIAAVGALLWVRFTPRDRTAAPPAHLAAVLRDPRVWQVAALFTFQNLVYYTVATWVPFLLVGRSAGYVATTFLFLNFFPIVPLFALSFVRWPYALSTPFYVVAGTLAATGSLGLLLGLTDFVQPLVFMVGLGTAAAFVASIALPPLIASDESEASTYSAVMYTAGYLRVFNGMIDRRPLLMVRCATDADVATAIAFAHEHSIVVAVRGGGHNVAGNAVVDGGMVIDLTLMRGVEVDPVRRRARVQGGACWSDLDAATQAHGLATPGGIISSTGVAGLTLGGGIGVLRGLHGLTCDNLVGADLVTASGEREIGRAHV